jgi:transposase
MLNLPPSVQIWLATQPTDLRKSFDSLAELVRQQIRLDPLSGHLFVFRNKRADRLKILYWDEDGYALWYKRLEIGTFHFPASSDGRVALRATDLQMLLDGIDLDSVKRRRRYRRLA